MQERADISIKAESTLSLIINADGASSAMPYSGITGTEAANRLVMKLLERKIHQISLLIIAGWCFLTISNLKSAARARL